MPKHEPIAIVGMACLLPKAPDLATYWRNILDKRDCLTDVPDDHSWKVEEQYDPDPHAKDKTYAKRGGFLDKTPFDPMEWGVTPSALDAIDTSQLLSLIVARQALKDAGIDPDKRNWPRERTSCIVGVTGTQELVVTMGARLQGPKWRKAMLRHGLDPALADAIVEDIGQHFPEWQEQSFPGLLGNVVSGRIANRLDLGGTNCAVDAACASSLAAVQLAMADLQSGRADLALSGGVDTLNDIFMYMCFSKTPAFSKTGDPKPFDANADGILISEGIAMTVMKRLSDAERDGDRIYAVIRGIGTSSDGKFKSIYAPNGSGQAVALRRAYAEAEFPLETVELIEAHGTGTKAGDLAEVDGLKQVFAPSTREGHHVAIGSVKSQIGHTKSTAGAAGLVKAALALYERVLPATTKVTTPNPKMGFDDSKLYVNSENRPWIRAKDHPRRAGLSSFGFGGTNYHIAMEEYGDADLAKPIAPADSELFLFAAKDATALRQQLDAVNLDAPTLTHAARTVLQAFQPGAERIGFLARSFEELSQRIAAARLLLAAGPGERDGVTYAKPGSDEAKLAVVFPGQGSQYVDMGRSLLLRHANARGVVDRAEDHFRRNNAGSLAERLYPVPAFDDASRQGQQKALTATEWAQPAIGAISKGMWDVLASFGVKPAAFAGHSYGELVALHAAGVIDEETLFTASRVRGAAMADRGTDRGTMAAVSGDLAAISAVLDTLGEGVVLANKNHPRQGVISGSRTGVAAALKALATAGLSGKEIQVSAAFHSPLVADARAPFEAAIAALPFGAPQTTVYANASAAPYSSDAASSRDLLARQITSPVEFVAIVDAMWESGVRTFVECGPKGVLGGLLKQCLKGRENASIISLDRDEHKVDGDTQLKRVLVALVARGVHVDVAPLLAEPLPPEPMKAKSKATVWLAGPNYRKPETINPPPPKYIPAKPVQIAAPAVSAAPVVSAAPATRPAPAPTSPARAVTAPVASAPAPKPAPAVVSPAAAAPAAKPAPMAQSMAPGVPMSGQLPSAVDANSLLALLDSTRSSLAAFQQTQERTASVHAEFLRAQARANESFTTLFATHARIVEAAAGLPVSAAPHSAPAPHYAPAAPVYAPPAPVYAAPAPAPAAAAPSFASSVEATLGTWYTDGNAGEGGGRIADANHAARPKIAAESDLPPMISPTHSGEVKAATPKSAPKATAAKPAAPKVAAPVVDVNGAMLTAVAEKTGYPKDMLEMGMDLEADLGIDSIKRVEILSSVQDRVPGLPELDNDRMSSLRTLQEVIDYLQASLGGSSAPVAAAPVRGSAVTPAAAAPQAASQGADVHEAMLNAVAEKTGYPKDMLEPGMDLEADLGIDSIKRVEILSAVQDRVPGLPELDNDRMSSLRTLAEVIGYLQEQAGGSVAAPSAAPAAGGSRDAIIEAMLTSVADKTGYPKDMLEMGMDLEADLGIDSIKRVEILSAVQDRVAGLPELDNDRMSGLRTLAEVTEYLIESAGGAEAAPVHAAEPLPEMPERRAVSLANAPDGQSVGISSPVAVLADVGGLAARLVTLLVDNGVVAHLVDVDVSRAESVAAAIPADTQSVIHMAAIGAHGGELAERVRSAFLAARTGKRKLFATVSGQGGSFGFAHRAGSSLEGALAGLPKTLSQEWDGARCLAIDIDPATVDLNALLAELGTDRGVVEIGLTPHGVVTVAANLEPIRSQHHSAPIGEGEVVAVSGGGRGVTAAVVLELAKRYRPHLVLLGRSAVGDSDPNWAHGIEEGHLKAAAMADFKRQNKKPTPKELDAATHAVLAGREIRATLAGIRSYGAQASYVPVDVRDPGAVETVLASFGTVRGVIHAAGVIADKLVLEKNVDAFDNVFATKVDGFEALISAIDVSELKFAAGFGSVAGRYGNRGQCDYAMGNEALAKRLLDLRLSGVPKVRCFDWGPWEAGMVTPALKKHFESSGIAMITLRGGAVAFCDELEAAHAEEPLEHSEVVYGGPEHGGPLVGKSTPSNRSVHRVALAQDRYLRDHKIAGKAVVPVAVVLEWMAQAARNAHPKLFLTAVRDIAVLKGVVVEGETAAVAVEWDELPATIPGGRSLAVRLVSEKTPTLVHYRANVDLSPVRATTSKYPGSNGLGKERYPYAVDEAYRRFLFHGASLQGIDEVLGFSDHGMVAKINPSSPGQFGPNLATDPLVVDSALQMMLLWVREKYSTAALPTFVGEYRQHAPFAGPVTVHLEMTKSNAAAGKFNASFVDAAGQVVATLAGGEYAASEKLTPSFRAAEA